jgi:hypothetical protein
MINEIPAQNNKIHLNIRLFWNGLDVLNQMVVFLFNQVSGNYEGIMGLLLKA